MSNNLHNSIHAKGRIRGRVTGGVSIYTFSNNVFHPKSNKLQPHVYGNIITNWYTQQKFYIGSIRGGVRGGVNLHLFLMTSFI